MSKNMQKTHIKYGFFHESRFKTNPVAVWGKHEPGDYSRFQVILEEDESGNLKPSHTAMPLPPKGIDPNSTKMGKFYAKFCLPGKKLATNIPWIGKSLDPTKLEIPEYENFPDWEDRFYQFASKVDL